MSNTADKIYRTNYDNAAGEALDPEAIAKQGERDGRSDARKLIRSKGGRESTEQALRNLSNRFAGLFGEKPARKPRKDAKAPAGVEATVNA